MRTFSGVRMLIILCVATYLLELGVGDSFVYLFALWPINDGFMPWQAITYAFLHGGWTHLLFNMLGLWMFGNELERFLGRTTVLQIYCASVLTAAAMQLLVVGFTGVAYPTLGASGGVFGLLLAYGMLFPRRIIVPLIPPIPMPAWLFVTLYGLVELTLGVTGMQEGVAHFAHLGGMIGAALVLWVKRVN